jgi:hypothetical protein
MSYSIPIYIILIDPIEIPSHLSSYKDAVDLVTDRWNQQQREGNVAGFVESTSRNWCHQHLLFLICQAY